MIDIIGATKDAILEIDSLLARYRLQSFNSADTCLIILQNDLNNLLDDVPLNVRPNMIIQMHGAPPHYGSNVCN